MAINIEKILTISATEWFEMNGKNPREYEARGVHSDESKVPEALAEVVPSKAEVVVGYRYYGVYVAGTALIPIKR
ncbi:MAG: hypothetical protein Q8L29_03200 [archaeon]|nr:hypothetical protein [archaeon]